MPVFSLTALNNDSFATENSKIRVQFSEPILKKLPSGFWGERINATNHAKIFSLKNSSGIEVSCNIEIVDDQLFILSSKEKLPAGRFELLLRADSLQDFGGMSPDNDLRFEFTVAASEGPCQSDIYLRSPIDDKTEATEVIKSTNMITATNKIRGRSKIIYRAANAIFLEPGFSVTPTDSAYFISTISDCK